MSADGRGFTEGMVLGAAFYQRMGRRPRPDEIRLAARHLAPFVSPLTASDVEDMLAEGDRQLREVDREGHR